MDAQSRVLLPAMRTSLSYELPIGAGWDLALPIPITTLVCLGVFNEAAPELWFAWHLTAGRSAERLHLQFVACTQRGAREA